jgi:hypothetical protein
LKEPELDKPPWAALAGKVCVGLFYKVVQILRNLVRKRAEERRLLTRSV